MAIDAAGEVGIGTYTPSFKLHVYSSDNTLAKFESTDDTAAIWIRDNDSSTYVGSAGSTSFIGATGALATTNLNIDTGGNVGIGTITPAELFHVDGGNIKLKSTSDGSNGIIRLYDSTGTESGQIYPHSSDMRMYSAADILLLQSGNVGIGTDAPATTLQIRDSSESTTLTNFTQALTSAGILIETDYLDHGYTPGLFWSTANNSPTKPKAGIFMKETSVGTYLYMGTSNSYSTGITNSGLIMNQSGQVGIGGTVPNKTLTIIDTGDFGTQTFTSAIVGGVGFKINDGGSSGTTLEIDNIVVRNTLRTHIFQKDVVKATNGILYISDSAVVSATTGTTTTGTVTVRVDKSASLVAGTTYWYKDANASDGAIVSVKFTCTNSTPTATGGTPGEDDE